MLLFGTISDRVVTKVNDELAHHVDFHSDVHRWLGAKNILRPLVVRVGVRSTECMRFVAPCQAFKLQGWLARKTHDCGAAGMHVP